MSPPVRVRVPATSANLGPGYDCAGLAIGLYDDLSASLAHAVSIEVEGEGADEVPRDDSHLVVRAIARTFAARQLTLPGVDLTCTNRIPHGRGLGSSSAAIVAGVLIGRSLLNLGEAEMSRSELLEIATEIEGHPDNVAPALFGGFTIAWQEGANHRGRALRLRPTSALQPVVAIATTKLATQRARELIPSAIPHAVAAANAGRAALLTAAVTDRADLLLSATEDHLHQEFRRFAYPESYALMSALRAEGIPAAISGAGPTVIAFGLAGTERDVAVVEAMMRSLVPAASDGSVAPFKVHAYEVDLAGAQVS